MTKKVEKNASVTSDKEAGEKKVTAVTYIWTTPSAHDSEEIVNNFKNKVTEYCKKNNIQLKKIFKDIGSTGSVIKRSEMLEMLRYIDRNKIDFLILDTLNSLGRRFHDAILVLNEFTNRKSSLISIDEKIDTSTEEGKNLLKALFMLPQINNMIQSNDSKKKVRVKEILYSGGACPYGYMIDNKSNQYKIIEEEASIVKRIFRERMNGRSLRQIANDLSNDDISTKRGGKWQANTIKTILENSFYIGVYNQNGTLVKDSHDFIISEYIFNKVNSIK